MYNDCVCPKCQFVYKQWDAEKAKLQAQVRKLKQIDVKGWKGKDNITFEHIGALWHVREHRKDKISKLVAINIHKIEERAVTDLWEIIKLLTPDYKKTQYRKIVPSLIRHYNLPIEVEEFNGGNNRGSKYFPLYYYPMKILEHKGYIRYGGSGVVVRLKE